MDTSASRRKIVIIVLGSIAVVLLGTFTALNAFHLKFLTPATTGEIAVFSGLSTVAFLLFVVVLVLLVRNVLKLYADQRSSVMGTRLRTRMLWGAVLVSVIPVVFMFLFSYDLMNRSLERWFSQNPDEIRDDSTRLALELAQYTSANARVEAESIAASLLPTESGAADALARNPVPQAAPADTIDRVLHQHEITLQSGFAVVYREAHPVAAFHMPPLTGAPAQVKPWLPDQPSTDTDTDNAPAPSAHQPGDDQVLDQSIDAAILTAAQRNDLPIFSIGDTDYALGTAAIKQGGTVVVGLPMPYGLSATRTRFQNAVDAYRKAYLQRREIRTLYLLLLLMMTSLALFACSWLALHLSKQVTKPVEALAEAMEAIAQGDYARRVAESSTEELGELVRSFNHMAADLEGSRRAVETSNLQLSAANATLEARRGELETMLETIPNGVATLDPNGSIVLANRALSEMLDPGGQTPFIGTSIEKIFPAEALESIHHLLRRSHRMGSASGEMEMTVPGTGTHAGGTMYLLATVALLETGSGPDRIHHGYVLVLENATELLRAQKQSAWKEVARRVAHEIKNPLTPISLSAEQIHRHIDRVGVTLASAQLESPSVAVIRRSSEVISSSVESMRSLVDQFAALAQFPTAAPRPAALNPIVENSLALFAGRLQNIRLIKRLAPDLPLVLADPEAMKRALGNLIDNSAEAMHESLLRELRVTTALLPSGMVELTVSDTGSGLTDEMRERLFLPYFSTKQRGTGLGLAIAAKIVQEHGGTIRAEKNSPAGATFIIELPPAPTAEPDSVPETASDTTVSTRS
ncbi:MAG: ATP-binding protein [Acidobacteriaceae bacterium]|jgi:nitrogen fixation/metabolism regulation signal transduction histidine kinase